MKGSQIYRPSLSAGNYLLLQSYEKEFIYDAGNHGKSEYHFPA
jgi:hypothetical protein